MNEAKKYRITITRHGPYLVTGGVPLTHRIPAMSTYGEPLAWDPVGAEVQERPVQEKYALCRCGNSQNKPFCDGTHAKVGFDGQLTASHEPSSNRRKTYHAHGFVMTDDASLCVHAGFCGTRFTNVWKMRKGTSDPEVSERLREMVAKCPSGRLEIAESEGGQPVEPSYEPSIATIPNGPLWVRGDIEIQDPDGFVFEVRNRVTLCRCGQSKNKPFCDGTHVEANFEAPAEEPIAMPQP